VLSDGLPAPACVCGAVAVAVLPTGSSCASPAVAAVDGAWLELRTSGGGADVDPRHGRSL